MHASIHILRLNFSNKWVTKKQFKVNCKVFVGSVKFKDFILLKLTIFFDKVNEYKH